MGDIISLTRELPSMTSLTTSSWLMPRCSAWLGICPRVRAVLINPVLTENARIFPIPSAAMDWVSARNPNLVML